MKTGAPSGFRDRFKDQLVGPDDPECDQARLVWNAMADRRAAVRLAQDQNLVIAVRGGGHSVAGFPTCDGGF